MSVYKSAYVPSVDNVGALYRLPWILAVVVVNVFLGNAFGVLIGSQRSSWLAL